MASKMDCSEVERIVWTEGPEAVPETHLSECRTCREEARRAGDLQAALKGMQTRFAVAPVELEPALIDLLTHSRLDRARQVVTHPKFWRGAAVGAAAAAAAATAAIGLIVVRRNAARPEVA